MTSVFRAHRRAEEFAAVVDGAPAPAATPEIAELAGVVTALRDHEPPALREEFAADLRERLMAEAATAMSPAARLVLPARTRGRREHRLVAAATVAVFLGGSASMAAAAQHALPGEALYPVKRGIEHAQAGLSTSPASRGQDLLHQADARLVEVAGLLAGPPEGLPQIPGTLDDFTSQAQQGAGLMMSSFQDTRDPATIVAVREFAARSLTRLQDLARTAPADSQDELASAAVALSGIDQQARDLCSSCAGGLPGLAVPATFLASAEVNRALRAIDPAELDNSHPVVVPRDAVEKVSGTAGTATSGSSAAPQPSPTPSPGLTLPALPSAGLPGADGSKTGSTDVTGQVDSTVKQLTDGLSGVAETLLPDPGDTTLP